MHRILYVLALVFFVSQVNGQQPNRQEFQPYESKKAIETAQIFGEGVISTREYELTTTFTPDGRTAYFTLSAPNYGKRHTIVFSEYQNGRWKTPKVATFSGIWSDADPFISPDGKRLYFISNRPLTGNAPRNNFDIFYVEKTKDGWSQAKSIGAPINSEASELYVTLTSDNTLYFVSARPDSKGQGDIYRSKFVNGKYAEPENLGDAINTKSHDTTPYISPDESYLIFASNNRPDGLGDQDLYISFWRNGSWMQAVNLGNRVNSSSRDYCPIVSPDGKYLFFSSDRGFPEIEATKTLSHNDLIKNFNSPFNSLGNVFQIDLAPFLKK